MEDPDGDPRFLILPAMHWTISHRADQRARKVADRHYNRQTPGSPQFVPPGRCFVLFAREGSSKAVWVTSWPYEEYTKHAWAGAWVNSLFRNEGVGLSSDLITEAVSATRWNWDPPSQGLITFVDSSEVGSGKPGYCYECAGFTHVGYTEGGLHAWQLLPDEMPEPQPPQGVNLCIF